MFCKNCGAQVEDVAVICVKCGTKKGEGTGFCQNCGKEVPQGANVCMNCGVAITNIPAGYEQKSKLVAGLLAIFLGSLGIHNFYLGNTSKGVTQLLICLLGSCLLGLGPIVAGVWGLVEGIQILTGSISKDGKGVDLKD